MSAETRKFRPSASATVVIVVVVLVCAAWAVAAYGGGPTGRWLRGLVGAVGGLLVGAEGNDWVGAFLRSRLTVQVGAIALGCLVGLYLLVGVALRLGRQERAGRAESSKQAGTAAIEFALLFPIILCIVLVMIQSVLLSAGNMAVHYAAYAAARAAVVWVPENVSYEEPRNVVASSDSSAKLHRIRSAAVYAVMPISAGKSGLGGSAGNPAAIQEGIERFYQLYGSNAPNWVNTMLPGKYQYAWNYTEVSLFEPIDGVAYGDHETLRVQVRHTLYLSVPYANWLFGDSLCASGCGQYGTPVSVTCALTNQGVEDEIDVEQFPRYEG